MPTENPRVNITIDKNMQGMLAMIAKKQKRPIADLARELIAEALERHEDYALSQIANKRDVKGAKRISHEEAWRE